MHGMPMPGLISLAVAADGGKVGWDMGGAGPGVGASAGKVILCWVL